MHLFSKKDSEVKESYIFTLDEDFLFLYLLCAITNVAAEIVLAIDNHLTRLITFKMTRLSLKICH